MEKIINVFNERFGISHVNKTLTLDLSENVYKLFTKTAKYIYKMGLANNKWKDVHYQEAVITTVTKFIDSFDHKKYVLKSFKVVPVNVLSDDIVDKINFALKPKAANTKWKEHIYALDFESKENSDFHLMILTIVDPTNSHIARHGSFYESLSLRPLLGKLGDPKKHYKKVIYGFYNADTLIGGYQLFKDMFDQATIKNPEDEELTDGLCKMFHRFETAAYRRKGYSYLFNVFDGLEEEVAKRKDEIKAKSQYSLFFYDKGVVQVKNIPGIIKRNKINSYIKEYLVNLSYISIQAAYDDDQLGKSHAKFFQTKKNIKPVVAKKMRSVSAELNAYLKNVELDNDTNLEKIDKLIPSLKLVLKYLPKSTNNEKPILRFRKIQNHHALGLFTAYNNTIALEGYVFDKKNVGIQSLIHEYGHFLDYNSDNDKSGHRLLLSLGSDFLPILKATREYLDKSNRRISSRQKSYLLTPTEVFARAFETYVSYLGLNNSWIADPDNYLDKDSDEYGAFIAIKDELVKYFDNKFPSLRSDIEKLIYDESHSVDTDKIQKRSNTGASFEFKSIPKRDANTIQLSFF